MSGHKRTTVSISEAEYRKLHDAEMKLRFMEERLPEALEEERKKADAALQKTLEEAAARENVFRSATRGLREEIRSLEWATSQAIMQQAEEVTQTLHSSQAAAWETMQAVLAQVSQQFKAEIAYEHSQTQAAFGWTREQFSALEDDHQRKMALALDWAQSAAALAAFIQDHYPASLVDPQRLDALENELRQVFLNLEQEIPESAISLAQHTYFQFSRWRVELENIALQTAWTAQAVQQGLQGLLAWAQSARWIPALDHEGNPLNLMVDVDYWTQGRLNLLTGEIQDALAAVEGSVYGYSQPVLKDLLETVIPAWQQALEDIVFQARLCVINSQIRINIAELILHALHAQGFQPAQGSYINDDMRAGYEAHACSLDGSEVVVQVNPLDDRQGRAEVHLISLDRELRTEHELRQRAREVSESLSAFGLGVGETASRGEYAQAEKFVTTSIAEAKPVYAALRGGHVHP
ncbi:MAG: hypothetical protein IT308_09505 [Anaerolineaceae bacterium]|nr:hypothetical protein [Anaerolineaceae bacterium]